MIDALDIRVRGIVQGVGFRPFVYRLARRYIINGWVLNDLDGVFIHAEGESGLLDGFVNELHMNPPAAADVREIELTEVPLQDCTTFEIRESRVEQADEGTLVSADLATCDDCLRELFDPADRRFRYPFINCTNCGPRFTVIDELPYDRPSTSMAVFEMCDDCAREYADPLDRRFHAQPDACWECGPHVMWARGDDAWRRGDTREASDAIFAEAAALLAQGGIVAVKGLGGFHLACDAHDERAVRALRERKHRYGKAFAVMAPDLDAVRSVCEVSQAEEEQLVSAARPIVLLRKRTDARMASGVAAPQAPRGAAELAQDPGAHQTSDVVAEVPSCADAQSVPDAQETQMASTQLAPGVADGLPELGVMLPATPVQHILVRAFREASGHDFLVMTSGNVSEAPIVTDDEEAREAFAGIADAILGNNRRITARYDDSVVRVLHIGDVSAKQAGHGGRDERTGHDAVQFIRRARGFAPVPVPFAIANPEASESDDAQSGAKPSHPAVFAAGPEQKNTFTLARDGKAYVSQHVGDMENADVSDAWFQAKARFGKLFDAGAYDVLACDAHPEYLASKWARDEAARIGKPLVEVQHHHAHVASVLGEHGLYGPACGIAFDGTGFGADGAIWGGEVLVANQADYERFANFAYLPMPGGAAAIAHPLRMAYGMLWEFDLLDHPAAQGLLEALGPEADVCAHMIETGLNTPYTSSVGRLFDAVSALLGVCTQPTYEGEAAIMLDAAREGWEGAAAAEADQNESKDVPSTHFQVVGVDGALAPDESKERPSTHSSTHFAADGTPTDGTPADAADRVRTDADNAARYAVALTKNAATPESTAHDTSVVLFDAEPTIRAVLDDMAAGVPVPVISQRFHEAILGSVLAAAQVVNSVYGISLVVLSGGVFMNRYLVENAVARLGQAGFTVALNGDLPPNDGCISFGQAVVAASR